MKFLGMGVPELIIILVVALLIFGPKNLPKLGAAMGKTVKNIRDGMNSKSDDEEGKSDKAAEKIEEAKDEAEEEEPKPKKTAKKARPSEDDDVEVEVDEDK